MSIILLKNKSGHLTGKAEVRFWIPGVGGRRIVFRSTKQADTAADMIPSLVAWRTHGEALPPNVRRWVVKMPNKPFAALCRQGLIPPEIIAARKTASQHLDNYLQVLRSRGRTAAHVTLTNAYARQAMKATSVVQITDFDAEKLTRYYAGLNLSARSKNARRNALAAFTAWLVREGHIDSDVLLRVPRVPQTGHDERPARTLTHEEEVRLLEVTRKGKLWRPPLGNGMTVGPEDRYWLYRLALETGLRASELRSLTRASFDLDGQPPSISVTKVTKGEKLSGRKQAVVQPLRADTAAELREYLAGKHPGARALRVPRQTAEMLRFDLEVADIPYKTDEGIVHFHALRHTFITDLARAGVHPKRAQDLARHADINLTMSRYTHTLLIERAAAVEALPAKSPRKRRRPKNG